MRFLPTNAVIVFTIMSLAAIARGDDNPKPLDPFNDIAPSALKVDVPSLIHVRTDKDAVRVRKELIAFIWKNDGQLTTTSDVVRADADLPRPLAGCQATCETVTIAMEKGFKSVVHHFRPKKPNKTLVIFHQGHDALWTGGAAETVKFCLAKGCSVMAFQMPLLGDNKRLAPATIGSHDDMAKLVSPELEPIKFFLEPVAVALNYALQKFAYEDVVMIGLSGGGWTTTLYAAIDPRVRLSFPVAGTLPDYLRYAKDGRDKGDWEQYYPALYKVANYLDLYILGSSGPGRKQRQVLNKYDSCCFAGVGYTTYEKHVKKAVADLGKGAFDVYLDESHRLHLVSNEALEKAIAPLLDEARKK